MMKVDMESIVNLEGKKALVFYGGWDGHEPAAVSKRIERILSSFGMQVNRTASQEPLGDLDYLCSLDLIVPVWTMGSIEHEHVVNVSRAVGSGTGMAGCHGGMCDAFRDSVLWQSITGGNWVSHPGGDGVTYTVRVTDPSHPVTRGIEQFEITSEQYYLHVDPAVHTLAVTSFPTVHWYHSTNGTVDVPQMWVKSWGFGRVFYSALGHHDDVFLIPEAEETLKRGLAWAASGKSLAPSEGFELFESDRPMF